MLLQFCQSIIKCPSSFQCIVIIISSSVQGSKEAVSLTGPTDDDAVEVAFDAATDASDTDADVQCSNRINSDPVSLANPTAYVHLKQSGLDNLTTADTAADTAADSAADADF